MTFAAWIDTFADEKRIDREHAFSVETDRTWHLMTYGAVIDAAKQATPGEQAAIKRTLVAIDFCNGDVGHYLRHLGCGLAESTDAAMFGERAA